MRGATKAALAWSGLLFVLAGGLALWSGGMPALLLVAGALPVAVAAIAHQLSGSPADPRRLPRASVSALVLSAGVAAAAVGLTAGFWLVLIGIQVVLAGAVMLWRELSGERRIER